MKGLFVALLGIFLLFASARAELVFDSSELDDIELDDLDILREIEAKHVNQDNKRENDLARQLASKLEAELAAEALESNNVPSLENPCSQIHCSAGKVCEIKDNVAQCVCIPECPEELEPRRHVCTNLNETMMSDCEVHRERCLCDTGDSKCNKKMHHVHINYYGPCKELKECSEDEMKDFPRRMREWLFNVMHDLADRKELAAPYLEMVHEAETNLTKRWINAAVWKWCDLDAGHDRSVSRHELFPIRANLLSLESCIAPFFENCDQNNDHRITLKEWGHCLEVDDDELTERCVEINKNPINEVYG